MTSKELLLSKNTLLSQILQNSGAAMLCIDFSGKVIWVNRRLEEITQYKAEEFEGFKTWRDFIIDEDYEQFNAFLQLQKSSPSDAPETLEIQFNDKSGIQRTAIISSNVLPDDRIIVLTVIDITEQKVYEQELEDAKNEAENSERLTAAFLANMSHEIRTPINGIIGFADLLKLQGLSPEKKELYLDQVIRGSHDLLKLIEKIITISRLDSGQLIINNREFNLNSRLKEIATKAADELKNRKKEAVEFSYQPGIKEKDYLINGDPIRLTEVLSNLLENAIKFTDSGRIEFGYFHIEENIDDDEPASLLFFVKDSGVGVEKSKKKIIFNRFVKVLEQEEALYKGAGLGLSICKELVQLFGGNIWVESTKGDGSRFFFTYPLSKDVNSKIESTTEDRVEYAFDWSEKVILIAEDIESNYLYIKELIALTKAKILRARDGSEAVELFESYPEIDLVIMDILMPEMDGYEATQGIRKLRPEIPVIAQSAFTFEGDIQDGLYAGCFNDYIMKPYTRKVLLAVINKYFSAEEKS